MQATPDRWRDMPRVSLGDHAEGSTVQYEYAHVRDEETKAQRG